LFTYLQAGERIDKKMEKNTGLQQNLWVLLVSVSRRG